MASHRGLGGATEVALKMTKCLMPCTYMEYKVIILAFQWQLQSCVRLQAESKIPKSKKFRNFEVRIYFSFFRTKLTSKNPKTIPIEFLVKKWSILM